MARCRTISPRVHVPMWCTLYTLELSSSLAGLKKFKLSDIDQIYKVKKLKILSLAI